MHNYLKNAPKLIMQIDKPIVANHAPNGVFSSGVCKMLFTEFDASVEKPWQVGLDMNMHHRENNGGRDGEMAEGVSAALHGSSHPRKLIMAVTHSTVFLSFWNFGLWILSAYTHLILQTLSGSRHSMLPPGCFNSADAKSIQWGKCPRLGYHLVWWAKCLVHCQWRAKNIKTRSFYPSSFQLFKART